MWPPLWLLAGWLAWRITRAVAGDIVCPSSVLVNSEMRDTSCPPLMAV
jgi:hypothetical protein